MRFGFYTSIRIKNVFIAYLINGHVLLAINVYLGFRLPTNAGA